MKRTPLEQYLLADPEGTGMIYYEEEDGGSRVISSRDLEEAMEKAEELTEGLGMRVVVVQLVKVERDDG